MNKIKFGIIGTSSITENFLTTALSNEEFELVAIYSRDIEKAKVFGNKFNAKLFFNDLDKFTTSKDFDAVYIASPNFLHKTQSIACLKGKKHVLCEKALGGNKKEVLEMIKIAKENNVLLMEAMIVTCLPNFLKAKESLEKLGVIRKVFFNYCQYSSRYDKFKNGIIENAFKREIATGAISDIGIYCVHPLINLFGQPQETIATGTLLHTGTDGSGLSILKYPEIEAIIQYSKISNSYIPCEIQGENGTMVIDNIHFQNVKIIYTDKTEEIISINQEEKDMCYELQEFIKTIKENKIESTLNTHQNSIKSIELIDTIRNQIGIIYDCD